MRPVSPTLNLTKEKTAKLVFLCNQADRNSRKSSFEKRGADVGRLNQKIRLNTGPNADIGRSPGRPRNLAVD